MPCQTKSGAKKPATRKANKPPAKKSTNKPAKSQATKENRFITDYFPTVSRRLLAAKSKLEDQNKQIQHCIQTRTDPTEHLTVTEFENKGKGIVASAPIKKGCFICEYSGDLIKVDEAKVC